MRSVAVAICLAAGLAPWPLVQAASPSAPARLAFVPAGNGEFQFNTGTLRGKLRPGGKARGLTSVVHLPSGLTLDQGEKGYGLFSHYRVFTTGRRYGAGAWDWPSEGRLLNDGAVETRWPAAPDRPFEMRAVYRWAGPATLDLETVVVAQTNLVGFEVFLASYFAPAFTNALALLADQPTGSRKPGFLAAEALFGDWLLFPRDLGILALVNDGRWRLEPHPVDWTIMPPLARPLAVRRAPHAGVTAALMASAADCFAVAMPHQAEGHYSAYLSLFGRNLKAGETARAYARLAVGTGWTEGQVMELHRAYQAELRSRR